MPSKPVTMWQTPRNNYLQVPQLLRRNPTNLYEMKLTGSGVRNKAPLSRPGKPFSGAKSRDTIPTQVIELATSQKNSPPLSHPRVTRPLKVMRRITQAPDIQPVREIQADRLLG